MTDQAAAAPFKPQTALVGVGAALALTLVATGFASHEMIRHLAQGTPVLLATLLAWRWPAGARWAFAPVFLFWILIAVGIWAFLLGLPSPLHGTFNPAERTCAALLGVVPAVGFTLYPRIRQPLALWRGLLLFLLFAGLTYGAFLLSTQPMIAHR